MDIWPIVRHNTAHRPSLRRRAGEASSVPLESSVVLESLRLPPAAGMVKIVTYNVNGLRPRVAQHGSLRRLLDALDADIICFQETKLSRQDLSGDVIMAEGYEAFISCNRTSRGRGAYSGVATFCRVTSAFSSKEVALPIAAEEGFAGSQGSAKDSENIGDFVLQMPVEEEGPGEITREELLKLDNEGRCIITDHGHFVLFNIYGPAICEDDEERVRFKLLFYKILQKRWECLLALGKRVFIVGDLNIAPGSIDRCDAPPGFEKQMFREWLRSMLIENGGLFFDAFRSKHPERTGAYTCFNQKVGAEEFNYGSRIDHILISGACFHHCNSLEDHNIFHCHVEDCEIMNHFRRRGDSENVSKWKGGRSSKLEGSDHVPVYIILNGIPEVPVHNTPSSAARYFPEIRGRQQSIVSFLSKGIIREVLDDPGLNTSKDRANESCCSDDLESKSISKEEIPTGVTEFSKGGNLPSPCKRRNLDHWINEGSSGNSQKSNAALLAPHGMKASFSGIKSMSNKKNKHNLSSQPTIKSFFRRPETRTGDANINILVSSVDTLPGMDELCYPKDDSLPANIQCTAAAEVDQDSSISCSLSTDNCNAAKDDSLPENIQCTAAAEVDQDSSISCSLSTDNCNAAKDDSLPENIQCTAAAEVGQDSSISCSLSTDAATLEWQRIQQRMKMTLPLCKGHREPCIPRSVKKGSNIGRLFYVCARAQGPSSNPEANCNHFQWASVKSKGKRQ